MAGGRIRPLAHKTFDSKQGCAHLALGDGHAAYTWTEEFAGGLDELLHIAAGARTTVMCLELLWWRCHRALIADVLRFLGVEVIHLLGEDPGTVHPYTSPARVADGQLTYPA